MLNSDGEFKITDTNQMKTYHFFDDSFGINRFKEGYDYIFNRMKKYIKDQSDYSDDIIAPIWGWFKYKNIKELDFDNCDLYKIELEIDDDKVLLSDFDYYENVVIAGIDAIYSSKKKKEELYRLEKELGIEVIYKEYDRMISPKQLKKADYIQATFYCLKKEYVKSITKVKYKSVDGFILDGDELVGYTGRDRELVIPNCVKRIVPRALSCLDFFDSVIIPPSVEYIDYLAFNCAEVKVVKILGKPLISMDAFDHCYELSDIYYAGSEEEFRDNILTDDDDNLNLLLSSEVNMHFMHIEEDD